MKQPVSLLLLIVLVISFGCRSNNTAEVYDLRCESLNDPFGIDKNSPRFSWKIKSDINGTRQKAFQLLVASEQAGLTESRADFWNSGKVETSSSILVSYKGKELNPGTSAWWKVRFWDENDNCSRWSEPARFSIGLLHEADWQAAYITFNTQIGHLGCPQVYSTFEVDNPDTDYFLHVNSLGYHEIYINGKRAGTGVLAPAVSQFNKRSLINTYLITPHLKKGKNELIIWLGSGWYSEGLPGVANNGPVVRAQLERINNTHREVILSTDEKWKGRKSSYSRHGNWRSDRFGGEIVDGTMALNDLLIDNPDNPWQPVELINIPAHEATPQMTEQNAITDTITPVEIKEFGPDTFLIDMGKNLTGWVRIDFPSLKKSQEIKLEYCDHLIKGVRFNDRNQFDKYIASGSSAEMFINKFNYHGFRFIRITGLKEKPAFESINAYLVQTDFEKVSGFECSDPDMNTIHNMLYYTLRCLSIGGDFVDCPQIERLGYGGDGNASTLTAQTMFNLGPLYNHWLQAWADVIREDGGMPHTAPNPYPAGGGPYWCGFIITAAWQTYLNYGDTLVLKKHYHVMQKWLDYVKIHSVDGLLKKWPDTGYRGWYLGDWATPEGIDQTDELSVDLVNNSFIAVCFDNTERIANVLGRTEDAQLYALKKRQLQENIHKTFYNEDKHTYGTGTQIDLAFPMIAGVVPENKTDVVINSLYHETRVNRGGHFATGLVGLPVFTEWAVKNKAVELMYSMLKKRSYPGYPYMIDNGATTTWEHWNGARSHIHNCYNGIGSWFYQAIGGICPVEDIPAYRKIRIQPQIPDGITWAKVFKATPYGKIAVNWTLTDAILVVEIEIPVGIEAEVLLPDTFNLLNNEYTIRKNGGVGIKSGKYKLLYSKGRT